MSTIAVYMRSCARALWNLIISLHLHRSPKVRVREFVDKQGTKVCEQVLPVKIWDRSSHLLRLQIRADLRRDWYLLIHLGKYHFLPTWRSQSLLTSNHVENAEACYIRDRRVEINGEAGCNWIGRRIPVPGGRCSWCMFWFHWGAITHEFQSGSTLACVEGQRNDGPVACLHIDVMKTFFHVHVLSSAAVSPDSSSGCGCWSHRGSSYKLPQNLQRIISFRPLQDRRYWLSMSPWISHSWSGSWASLMWRGMHISWQIV